MKEALLQDGFREKIEGNDGHIYLKVLREEIAKELNFASRTDVKDFLLDKIAFKDSRFQVDAEGRYNTSSLNNTEAVGYDNFSERAANPDKNRELAHETIFDKLLSEYFVNKRATIHNVN